MVGFNVNRIAWTSQYRISYGIISFLITVLLSYQIIGIDDYIKRLSDYTTIYEDYYIDGRKIAIEFPEQRQNLILSLFGINGKHNDGSGEAVVDGTTTLYLN